MIEYVARPVLSAVLTGPTSDTTLRTEPEREVRLLVRTGLAEARRILGRRRWRLAQEHYGRLDDFQARYVPWEPRLSRASDWPEVQRQRRA